MNTSATFNKCIEKKHPHTALKVKTNTVKDNTTVRNLHIGGKKNKGEKEKCFSVCRV